MSREDKNTGSRGHPLDALEEEHQVILAVLEAVGQRSDAMAAGDSLDASFWLSVVEFLENFVDRWHAAKEEELLFPVLKQCGVPGEGGPLAVMRHEHVECRALKDRLRGGVEQRGRDEVLRSVRALCYLLSQHIAKEENVLFQMARRLWDPDQVEEVRLGFERVEEALGEGAHGRFVEVARRICAESGVPFDMRRSP